MLLISQNLKQYIMQDKMMEKTDAEAIDEIIGILKESALYSELSKEEQEKLIRIILSS